MVLPVMVQKGMPFSKGSLACCTLVHASFGKNNTNCLSVTVDGLDVTRVVDLWIFSIGIVHILRLVLIVCCSGAVSFTATADLQHQKMLFILLSLCNYLLVTTAIMMRHVGHVTSRLI